MTNTNYSRFIFLFWIILYSPLGAEWEIFDLNINSGIIFIILNGTQILWNFCLLFIVNPSSLSPIFFISFHFPVCIIFPKNFVNPINRLQNPD